MNTVSKAGVCAVLVGISLSTWAAGPCMPIARACMQSGGGYHDKDTLLKECVVPVAMGKKTLANANISDSQREQCKATIAQKVKSKMQDKMNDN